MKSYRGIYQRYSTDNARRGTEMHLAIERKMMLDACRAVRRLYGEATSEWDTWQYLDSRFDGGEFSGPLWDQKFENELDRTIGTVARQFGLARHDLCRKFDEYVQEESYRFVSAMIDRPREPATDGLSSDMAELEARVLAYYEDWNPDIDEYGRSVGECPKCESEARLDGVPPNVCWRCSECGHRSPSLDT